MYDGGDGPVGSNNRILYGGNNVEGVAFKNNVVETNGKSTVDGVRVALASAQRRSTGGEISIQA